MTKNARIRYEMLLRVRDFGKAHRELFLNSPYGQEALAKVGEAIDTIEKHTMNRMAAMDATPAQAARRKIIIDRMQTIARTSRRIVLPTGQMMNLTVPRQESNTALVAAVRAFLEKSEAHHDDLVKFGLPASCLTDLRETLAAFEAAMADRRLGRSGIALAKKGVSAALADGSNAVRNLDTVVRNLVGDAPLLAAWERDMRIVGGKGKSSGPAEAGAVPAVADPHPAAPAASSPATPSTAADPTPEALRRVS